MNKGEYLSILSDNAKKYYKNDVLKSIKRNSHMNNYNGENISDETIKAILVDFINFVGMEMGVDYAMYSKNITDTL